MHCQFCGSQIPEGDQFCAQCGARAPVAPPAAGTPPPPGAQPPSSAAHGTRPDEAPRAYGSYDTASASQPPQWTSPYFDRDPNALAQTYRYSGFWLRFGAFLLDWLFGSLLAIIPGIILAVLFYLLVQAGQEDALTAFEQNEQDDDLVLAAAVGFLLGFLPTSLGYQYVSTALGGGWGKRICGLRIIRKDDGQRPGYGTGGIRVLVTFGFSVVGNIPLVGWVVWLMDYLWMLWDPEKQTLHDKAADTLVVQV